MKYQWLKIPLLIICVFVVWFLILMIYGMIASDEQSAMDAFAGTAFLLAIAVVLLSVTVDKSIRFINRALMQRTQCEEMKEQIDIAKSETDDLTKRLMSIISFYYREKQPYIKTLLESMSSLDPRIAGAQSIQAELLRALTLDAGTSANVEVQALIAQISARVANISTAKKAYNNTVSKYNAAIGSFPALLMQSIWGLDPLEYYVETKNAL